MRQRKPKPGSDAKGDGSSNGGAAAVNSGAAAGNSGGDIDIDLPEGAVRRYAARDTQGFASWLYAWITVSLFSSLFLVVPLVSVGLVVGMLLMPLVVWPAAAVWLALALWPNSAWPAFTRFFCRHVIAHWMPVFKLRIIMDGELPPQTPKGYLLGVHPHGIVPLGGLLYMGWLALYSPSVFGGTAVASIVLKMPIFRQLFTWWGFLPADVKSVRRTLLERNLGVVPGGIAELMLCSRDTETLYLKKRKGFARVAGETGAQLVPSYVFGQTQFFNQLSTSSGFASRVSRALRMSLTIFWGRFGLPIPFQAPVTMVFGRPLDMTGDPDVDLENYIAALRALFDKYKHYAGYGDKVLHIR